MLFVFYRLTILFPILLHYNVINFFFKQASLVSNMFPCGFTRMLLGSNMFHCGLTRVLLICNIFYGCFRWDYTAPLY